MTQNRNGPLKEDGPGHHTGPHQPSPTSHQPSDQRPHSTGSMQDGGALRCESVAQLRRRRHAANRSVPLDCGCRDPWGHRCTEPPLSDKRIDAARDAAEHLLEAGLVPLLEIEVLQALWRRGGDDRAFAQRLDNLTGGLVA